MIQLPMPFLNSPCCRFQSLSHGQLFATPWTVARQAPLSMGILQARILGWVHSSRGFSNPGIKPRSCTLQAYCLPSEPSEKPTCQCRKSRLPMQRTPLPMQETWVQPLGWEDPLEEGMATTSVLLPEKSPWTEEPGGLQSRELQRVRHD